jgi:hypothetical protein
MNCGVWTAHREQATRVTGRAYFSFAESTLAIRSRLLWSSFQVSPPSRSQPGPAGSWPADDCPLGNQDVQQGFDEEETERWTALTWNGQPAVCKSSQNQAPEEVLARGQTTYDLFTADNGGDDLSGYL